MKKSGLILAIILLGGFLLNSCGIVRMNGQDLFKGCMVYYDCGGAVSGDDTLCALTDGDRQTSATLSAGLKTADGENISLPFTDWNGETRMEQINNSAVDFYIDLGFMGQVNTLLLHFDEYSGAPIKVFSSTDGYNFSFFLGEFDGYDHASKVWKADLGGVFVKSVMFVIPSQAKESIIINSAEAYGQRDHERVLLSKGAAYDWDGAESLFFDNGKKLTDGQTADFVAKTSSETDALTQKRGSVITLDLGAVKNVSEVNFGAFFIDGMGTAADRIDVRYSENGKDWLDFGQSYIRTGGASKRYLVTRNHTVGARYLKIYTYTEGLFICDEISVYGSQTPVCEPDYGYAGQGKFASNTNAASCCEATLNGRVSAALTDNVFSDCVRLENGKNTVTVKLENTVSFVGASLVIYGDISDIQITVDGKRFEPTECFSTTAAYQNVYYLLTNESRKAKEIVLTFDAEDYSDIAEVIVYASAPQLPYVRGGFFQIQTSGGVGESDQNSDYSWYLQLKGMRDMGMEYVVIQYASSYNDKTTLVNGKRITAAGYTYNPTYGSRDLCKAVLDAAEKLGMKVWLGTIYGKDFSAPAQNMGEYEKLVVDSQAIIDDIYELYGKHPAFGGYYLSDETCDQWLNLNLGVEAARYVYKGQSDRIRELDANFKIMIAPAIWRHGDPLVSANNLYRMIAPENPGERPIVDIVAAQDCLGRETTLTVDDGTYLRFLGYAEQWATAVRQADAEFWHDAEVFEITYTQKRHEQTLKTLSLEAPLSGNIIVFDIPHYFSIFPMGRYDDKYDYFKRLKMREYAEYYSTLRNISEADFFTYSDLVFDGKIIPDDFIGG